MYKNCNIIMLPTNEKTVFKGQLILNKDNNNLYISNHDIFKEDWTKLCTPHLVKPQHLYITSEEKIKKDDWAYNILSKSIIQFTQDFIEYYSIMDSNFPIENYKKIIATSDKNLVIKYDERFEDVTINKNSLNQKLPQLPQQLIYDYIVEYNKGNVITKIEVEYEDLPEINAQKELLLSKPDELIAKAEELKKEANKL